MVPAMEDRGRLSIASPMRVFRPGGSGEAGGRSIGFATPAGYVAFDDAGAAVAVDALDATGEIVAAALGDAYAVTVQTRAMTAATANEPVFAMHALERASGRLVSSTPLVLYGTVRRVESIDGFVLVNAGEASAAPSTVDPAPMPAAAMPAIWPIGSIAMALRLAMVSPLWNITPNCQKT